MHGGHYYTYIKAENGIWYQFSDSNVMTADFDEIKALKRMRAPQGLFYRKTHNCNDEPADEEKNIHEGPMLGTINKEEHYPRN